MNIIQSIELFTAINLAIIGLSHFLQPKIWVDFFEFLSAKGHTGNIFNAMISLGMRSFILSFHFLWIWPKILVTVYGLLLVIKGAIYLIKPSLGLKSIGKVNNDNAHKFKWVGLVMFLFSILIVYWLFVEEAFK